MADQDVTFTMYFGQDNRLEVEATVEAIIPARPASLDYPGDPAEGGEVEITSCKLVGDDDVKVDFEPDGIYIRPFRSLRHKLLTDEIEELAFEQAYLYE